MSSSLAEVSHSPTAYESDQHMFWRNCADEHACLTICCSHSLTAFPKTWLKLFEEKKTRRWRIYIYIIVLKTSYRCKFKLGIVVWFCVIIVWFCVIKKKIKRKVQRVPQSQTAAYPRHQKEEEEEKETDKTKQAQIKQTNEKHQD